EITVHRADAPSSRVVLLAQDRSGYRQLCRLISLGRARSPKGSSAVLTGEVQSCSEGLIALCPAPDLLPPLRDAFEDRLYALIARHRTAREMHTELELRT